MHNLTQMESLLMGQLRLLEENDINCPYYHSLQKEYEYLVHKYVLPPAFFKVQFTKLRPPNFPTIRLAQVAALYHQQQALFDKCMSLDSYEQAVDLLGKIVPSRTAMTPPSRPTCTWRARTSTAAGSTRRCSPRA